MRLTEATVQMVAQQYLEKRYRWKARGRIFSELEVRTKKTFGGKRADGLMAYKRWFWGVHTVALEAKSYKTLPAVRPFFDTQMFIWRCFVVGLIFMVLTGAVSYLYRLDDGFVQFLLPVTMCFLGSLLYGLLSYRSYHFYKMPVISQLAQYPANEQWLAFSIDTLHGVAMHRIKQLHEICYRNGVGLLIVSPAKRVEVVILPRRKWRWWGDFLQFYAKENAIRKFLKTRNSQ